MMEKEEIKKSRKYLFPIMAITVALAIILFLVFVPVVQFKEKVEPEKVSVPKAEIELAKQHLATLPVREPKRAGLFYPQDEQELYKIVDGLLATGRPLNLTNVRSVLVPHAGYVYSGDVAAASLRELNKRFERVFILAANHSGQANFSGVSLPDVRSYIIPGAEIPLAPEVVKLRQHPLFVNEPLAHEAYMIEVELPFLYTLSGRETKPTFSIIPMILGQMDYEAIKQLAEILNHYVDDKTVFVFSVDLSHFYTDQEARRLDASVIDSILSKNIDGIARATTDGNHVLMTMAELARLNGWNATLLKHKNSGEVSGDRNRVVGYAGIAFHEPVRFTTEQEDVLLSLARKTIEQHLETGNKSVPADNVIAENSIFGIPRGVFVTLKKNGHLRGCIGDLVSNTPLYEGVMTCAIQSATQDSRFKPVTRAELDELELSISVLEYPQKMKVSDPREYVQMLQPGRDGVIMYHNGRSSTYLPQVWEDLPDPVQFLSRLCMKQNAPADCWLDPKTVLFKYSAYEFAEKNRL